MHFEMFYGILMGHMMFWANVAEAFLLVFSRYVGYNNPEQSKHRKRSQTNLSSDQLRHLSNELVAVLQGSIWSRAKWIAFKPDVFALAECLAQYADYLSAKNKSMKVHHSSPISCSRNFTEYQSPLSTCV